MNKNIKYLLAGLVIVVVAYPLSAFIIGRVIGTEVDRFAAELAEREDMQVHRFDYDGGVFNGVLHYELAYRPPSWAGELEPARQTLRGEMAVRHGPWVGDGFALAASQASLVAPAELRESLPDLAEPAHLLSMRLHLGLDRVVTLDIDGTDYDGRVVSRNADASSGTLRFSGLVSTMQFDSTLAWLKAELSLREWSVDIAGPEPLRARLGPLEMGFDGVEAWPQVWVGRSEVRLRDVELGDDEVLLQTPGIDLTLQATQRDSLFDQITRFDFGPINLGGARIGGGGLAISLRGVDGEALSRIVRVLQQRWHDPASVSEEVVEQILRDAAASMFAGHPEAGVDRIGLNVLAADDIRASASVAFAGTPGVNLDDPQVWIQRTEVKAAFRARLDAVQELIRLATEAEASRGALDAGEISRTAAERYFGFMGVASQTPYLLVDADEMRFDLAVANGRILVNGNEIDPMEALGVVLGMGALLGSVDTGGSVAVIPDANAPAFFATISLAEGFRPDPQSIPVTAGGMHYLDENIGLDCVGHVRPERPDVSLDYLAGGSPLILRAESQSDTALIVFAADGRWHCNDDGPDGSLNPEVEFAAPRSGAYRIWVGSLDPTGADAVLSISGGRPPH